MTTALSVALPGFGKAIQAYWPLTTSASGSTTTFKGTTYAALGDDWFVDRWVKVTSGSAIGEIRRITDSTTTAGTTTYTVAPAFSASIAGSVTVELYTWDPTMMIDALNEARDLILPELPYMIVDTSTITVQGERTYPWPASILDSPRQFEVEEKYEWGFPGQLITNGNFATYASGTFTGWTETDCALTQETNTDTQWNPLVREQYSAKTVTDASGTAAAISQAYTSPAALAGKTVTLWFEIFCTIASRVRIYIQDGAGTNYSSYHGGTGWETLSVTLNVVTPNATTLNWGNSCATGSVRVTWWVGRAMAWVGDRPKDQVWHKLSDVEVDRVNRTFTIGYAPASRFLRVTGQGRYSSQSAVTDTSEIDGTRVLPWYWKAGVILYEWLQLEEAGVNAGSIDFARAIALLENKYQRYTKQSGFKNVRLGRVPRRVRGNLY
jgi:hypothetical protein